MKNKTNFRIGIKNFFVSVKAVKFKEKGLRNIINYFLDEKRHPDGIINFKNLSNGEKFFLKTVEFIEKMELYKSWNGKAGRKIQSYADSFCFAFPKGLEINREEYKKIITDLLKKLYFHFSQQLKEEGKEIDFNTFINNIFINVHTNKHIHINVLFPRVFQLKGGGLYSNRITNRKKFLTRAKASFNSVIKENFNLTTENYKPQTSFRKGYKSIYLKKEIEKINKEKEELEEIKEEIENKIKEFYTLKELIEMKRKEIQEETKKIIKDIQRREEIAKNFQLVIRYYKSFITKIKNNEIKGIIKEYNKLMTKIKEFEEINKNKKLKEIIEEIKEDTENYKNKFKFKM
jgi:hypothetical protein